MNISVNNITYKYDAGMPFESTALECVSFEIKSGSFTSLIGHTGSGKSTLVQILAGLIKPYSGEVLADGINISEKTPQALAERRKLGIVFQYPEYQLFEESVIKDVEFGPKNMGLSEEECRERAERALEMVGIDPELKGEVSPFSLSGGEKRRVAIAGVLAMEPELLILDEPAAGLDPLGRDSILNLIVRIKENRNLTIVLISHDMDSVARFSDRVIVLNEGKKLMEGSPSEVFGRATELQAVGLDVPSGERFLIELKNALELNGSKAACKISPHYVNLQDTAKEIASAFGHGTR